MKLKTYAPNIRCPKCDCDEIGSSYHNGDYGCCSFRFQLNFREHICRYCKRCGFTWPEACLHEFSLLAGIAPIRKRPDMVFPREYYEEVKE